MTAAQAAHSPDAVTASHIAGSTQGTHQTGGKRAPNLGENNPNTPANPPLGQQHLPGGMPVGNALGMIMGGFAVAAPILAKLQQEMLKILEENGEMAVDQISTSYDMVDSAKSAAIAQGNLEGDITQQDMIASFTAAAGSLLSAGVMVGTQVKSNAADNADSAEETTLKQINDHVETQYPRTDADVTVGAGAGSSGDPVTQQGQEHIEQLKRGTFAKNFEGDNDPRSNLSDKDAISRISRRSDLDEIKKQTEKRQEAINTRRNQRSNKLNAYSTMAQTASQAISGLGQGVTKNAQIQMQEEKGLESGVGQQAQFLQGQSEEMVKKFEDMANTQKQNLEQLNQTARSLASSNSAGG